MRPFHRVASFALAALFVCVLGVQAQPQEYPPALTQEYTNRVATYPVISGTISDVRSNLTKTVRLQIDGVVLLAFGPGYFFLHDDTGDIRVRSANGSTPNRGEHVIVTGLPRLIESSRWIELADIQHLGDGEIPSPVPISATNALKELHDAQYITLRGRVLNSSLYVLRGTTNEALLFDSDTVLCKALFPYGTGAAKLFPPNTFADFSGICRLGGRIEEVGQHYVHVLVAGPQDVHVIETAPIWSQAALRRIFLGMAAVAAMALAWIIWQRQRHVVLEHRVNARTAELKAEITARERAEDELRVALQAEKELNQLKSSFVSMVSHEFRTPLEVILSSSNILDRYLDRLPPDKRAAQLRAIRKSVHRMNDLIDDVLLLGKFDAGALLCQPVPLNLGAFCRRTANEIESASARDGAIRFTPADACADACADEGLLQHILTNILGNAVKYSPPDRPVEFILRRHDPNVEFIVRDQGCGIPQADQSRLFTAFYRGSNVGKTSGSGLGLVIAKRCVDLHGGTIRCESTQDAGTTFTITLPLFDGARNFHRRPGGQTQLPS